MSWKSESQRHRLARKGIRSVQPDTTQQSFINILNSLPNGLHIIRNDKIFSEIATIRDGNTLIVMYVNVRPDMRRHGYFGKLLDDFKRTNWATTVYLVSPDNPITHKVGNNLGYTYVEWSDDTKPKIIKKWYGNMRSYGAMVWEKNT